MGRLKVEFMDGLILKGETREDFLVLAILEQSKLIPQLIHLPDDWVDKQIKKDSKKWGYLDLARESRFKEETLEERFKHGLHIRWNWEKPAGRDPTPLWKELIELRRKRHEESTRKLLKEDR